MDEEQNIAIVRETFDSVCDRYDHEALRFFAESAKHLAASFDLRGDERVLDVATGTGHAALAIGGRLPRGHVTGIDFSPGMLEQARKKASSLGLANVDFEERDMRALGFAPDYFDAAVCAFGIFFVEDMDAQLARIAGMVKPGGWVAITSFRDDYFQPLKDMMHERLSAFGVKKPPQTWRQIASKEGCRELFERAGLRDIHVELKDVGYYLEGARDWWDVVWNAGFRRLVSRLEADDLERFKEEHLRDVDALKTPNGIRLSVPVLFTVGIKR